MKFYKWFIVVIFGLFLIPNIKFLFHLKMSIYFGD
jgi:hypothetical protein